MVSFRSWQLSVLLSGVESPREYLQATFALGCAGLHIIA